MTKYYLIFYATNKMYSNKRFKFTLSEIGFIRKATRILDYFRESGNQIITAFILIDHLNKLNQIIESQTINLPISLYKTTTGS